MNTATIAAVASLAGMLLAGCSAMKESWASTQEWYAEKQVERRQARQKEFERLAALPPAQLAVVSSRHDIANCARLSRDLFNDAQPKMRAYVAFIETSREFTGFINDIQYCIDEEKLSSQDAFRRVFEAVTAADANLPEDEKVWPKIQRGLEAYKILGTDDGFAPIMALISRCSEIRAMVFETIAGLEKQRKKLRKLKKNKQIDKGSYARAMDEITLRQAECAAVNRQLSATAQCISFMMDQHNRVKDLESYAR